MQKSKLQFKIQNFLLAVILAMGCFIIAIPARAAEIFWKPAELKIAPDQTFETAVFLNTENEEINAAEGKIIFPSESLELKEIRDGNSIINFWVEKPRAESNFIIFSGVIPGGYNSPDGLLLSLVFRAKKEGAAILAMDNIKILLNDGAGTEAGAKIANNQFTISEQAPAPQPVAVEKKDIDLPEAFEPIITSDPAMFGGKYFLVFAAQDKGSGLDHYEVAEGERPFIRAESPYLLTNQKLDALIFVKAIDKAGNARISSLPAQHPSPSYKKYLSYGIIIAELLAAFIVLKFLWRIWRKIKN